VVFGLWSLVFGLGPLIQIFFKDPSSKT